MTRSGPNYSICEHTLSLCLLTSNDFSYQRFTITWLRAKQTKWRPQLHSTWRVSLAIAAIALLQLKPKTGDSRGVSNLTRQQASACATLPF